MSSYCSSLTEPVFADGDVYVKGYGALGLGPENVDVDDFTKVELDKSFGRIVRISGSADYIAAFTGRSNMSLSELCFLNKRGRYGHRSEAVSTTKMVIGQRLFQPLKWS